MTPLQIRMMLHYYAIAEPYAALDPLHSISCAVHEQRNWLESEGMLQEARGTASGWRTTERGNAYVDALQNMRLPVCKWVIPATASD